VLYGIDIKFYKVNVRHTKTHSKAKCRQRQVLRFRGGFDFVWNYGLYRDRKGVSYNI